MFKSHEHILRRHKEIEEESLLEIFILIEENTMSAKVEALRIFSNLYKIKDKLKANHKMKEVYAKFNNTKTK
jgi:hypothetical protein